MRKLSQDTGFGKDTHWQSYTRTHTVGDGRNLTVCSKNTSNLLQCSYYCIYFRTFHTLSHILICSWTKWTSSFSNSQVNELTISCLLEIHRSVHCIMSSPIISSLGNSRLYSKRVVYKWDQSTEIRLLIWASLKVKANFHSVQPNKLWVASVVELPELFCYLSTVNITGALSAGGLSDGSWRGGECAVVAIWTAEI